MQATVPTATAKSLGRVAPAMGNPVPVRTRVLPPVGLTAEGLTAVTVRGMVEAERPELGT